MSLPLSLGDPDGLTIFLRKQFGIVLKGDAELHLMGEMPLRLHDAIPAATLSTAISTSALSTGDKTSITTRLAPKKITK